MTRCRGDGRGEGKVAMSESEHTQSRGEERYTNHYSFISPPGAGDQPVTGGDFPRDGKVFTQALRMSGSQTGAQVEKVVEKEEPIEFETL